MLSGNCSLPEGGDAQCTRAVAARSRLGRSRRRRGRRGLCGAGRRHATALYTYYTGSTSYSSLTYNTDNTDYTSFTHYTHHTHHTHHIHYTHYTHFTLTTRILRDYTYRSTVRCCASRLCSCRPVWTVPPCCAPSWQREPAARPRRGAARAARAARAAQAVAGAWRPDRMPSPRPVWPSCFARRSVSVARSPRGYRCANRAARPAHTSPYSRDPPLRVAG